MARRGVRANPGKTLAVSSFQLGRRAGPGGTSSEGDAGRLRSGLESQEWMNRVRLPGSEVVMFTRQLQVLLGSGVPISRALEVLADQTDRADSGEVFFSLQRLVLEGRYLSASLARFPAVFSPVRAPTKPLRDKPITRGTPRP